VSFTASLNEIVERNEHGPLAKHASWCRVPLSFVATVLNGCPFASENFTRSDGMPLLRIRDVRQRETEAFYKGEYDPTYLVEPNELVVGMDGDFHCALWKGPVALLNQRVCKITVNEGFYGRKLLSFVLPGYLNAINAETSSVTVKHLSSRTVAEIPLPLPPVKEQGRIVSEIEKQFTRLDAAIEALKRVQANLKRYRASVLKAACEGRLVPTEAELARAEGRDYEPADKLLARILKERRARWEADQLAKMHAAGGPPKEDTWKAKYREPATPDVSSLPNLPEGWVWASAECLGAQGEQPVLTGPFGTNMGKTDFADSGAPVLTIGCLTHGGIKLDKAVFVSELKAVELERYRLRTGDMLFSRMATVGRAGVVTSSLDGALFNYHLMRLRLSPSAVLPEFFMAYVRGSEAVDAYIRDVNHGATRPGINTDQLLRMPIVLPPLAEQHRIVAEVERRLSVTDELESLVEANLKRAERLRQAILKRAFEGKLVPQDPSDEPASALLERIKAAKSGGGTATPGCAGNKLNSKKAQAGVPVSQKINQ